MGTIGGESSVSFMIRKNSFDSFKLASRFL